MLILFLPHLVARRTERVHDVFMVCTLSEGRSKMLWKQMPRKLMQPKRLTPWRKRYGIQLNGILQHGTH